MLKLQNVCVILLCAVSILEAGEFMEVKGTEYFISYPQRKNWFQAQRFCTYYGLHLISIHSLEEEQIILSVIDRFKIKHNITKATHLHVYTSGSDLGHVTNDFYWTTSGHQFIYTNWLPGFPTAGRSAPDLSLDCVILNDQHGLKWQNLNCTYQYNFMCQNHRNVPEVNRDQC